MIKFASLLLVGTILSTAAFAQQKGTSTTNMNTKGEGVTVTPQGTTMGNGPDRSSTYYPRGHEHAAPPTNNSGKR